MIQFSDKTVQNKIAAFTGIFKQIYHFFLLKKLLFYIYLKNHLSMNWTCTKIEIKMIALCQETKSQYGSMEIIC